MIAFDHEPVEVEGARANDLSPEQLTANARVFCNAVEAAGFSPAVYGNEAPLPNKLLRTPQFWSFSPRFGRTQ